MKLKQGTWPVHLETTCDISGESWREHTDTVSLVLFTQWPESSTMLLSLSKGAADGNMKRLELPKTSVSNGSSIRATTFSVKRNCQFLCKARLSTNTMRFPSYTDSSSHCRTLRPRLLRRQPISASWQPSKLWRRLIIWSLISIPCLKLADISMWSFMIQSKSGVM